jgi:hypothetical protein
VLSAWGVMEVSNSLTGGSSFGLPFTGGEVNSMVTTSRCLRSFEGSSNSLRETQSHLDCALNLADYEDRALASVSLDGVEMFTHSFRRRFSESLRKSSGESFAFPPREVVFSSAALQAFVENGVEPTNVETHTILELSDVLTVSFARNFLHSGVGALLLGGGTCYSGLVATPLRRSPVREPFRSRMILELRRLVKRLVRQHVYYPLGKLSCVTNMEPVGLNNRPLRKPSGSVQMQWERLERLLESLPSIEDLPAEVENSTNPKDVSVLPRWGKRWDPFSGGYEPVEVLKGIPPESNGWDVFSECVASFEDFSVAYLSEIVEATPGASGGKDLLLLVRAFFVGLGPSHGKFREFSEEVKFSPEGASERGSLIEEWVSSYILRCVTFGLRCHLPWDQLRYTASCDRKGWFPLGSQKTWGGIGKSKVRTKGATSNKGWLCAILSDFWMSSLPVGGSASFRKFLCAKDVPMVAQSAWAGTFGPLGIRLSGEARDVSLDRVMKLFKSSVRRALVAVHGDPAPETLLPRDEVTPISERFAVPGLDEQWDSTRGEFWYRSRGFIQACKDHNIQTHERVPSLPSLVDGRDIPVMLLDMFALNVAVATLSRRSLEGSLCLSVSDAASVTVAFLEGVSYTLTKALFSSYVAVNRYQRGYSYDPLHWRGVIFPFYRGGGANVDDLSTAGWVEPPRFGLERLICLRIGCLLTIVEQSSLQTIGRLRRVENLIKFRRAAEGEIDTNSRRNNVGPLVNVRVGGSALYGWEYRRARRYALVCFQAQSLSLISLRMNFDLF